jgi:sugar lactone lactonase YvrE
MRSFSIVMIAASAVLFSACGDDDDGADGGGGDASVTDIGVRPDTGVGVDTGGAVDAGFPDTGPSDTGPADTGNGSMSFLIELNPVLGELPEGIAVGRDGVYVGLFALGRILRVTTAGQSSVHASLPSFAVGSTVLAGLAAAPSGAIYAAYATTSSVSTATTGVYRVPPGGGDATLFATTPGLGFINDIDLDGQGNLYVSDSTAGRIYKVTPNGMMTLWTESPLVGTSTMPCGSLGAGFPIGANGLVVEQDALIVANTERAIVARIPIEANGSAGTGSIIAGPDCERIFGIDGLVREGPGSWLGVVQGTASLIRIQENGTVTTVAQGGLLDGPASVDLSTTTPARSAYITNSTFVPPPGGQRQSPGVVKIDL